MLKCLVKTVAVAAIASATIVLPAAAENWDMPTPYPDATFHTQNIRTFAEEIDKATGGKLKITVHSAGSLFKHPEIKNAVRSGQVQIGEFFMSLIANEDPVFGLDSQPFLVTTYEGARQLWEAQKPAASEALAQQNLVLLYAVAWPPQGLYTKTKVEKVDDLRGMKFRVYNQALEQFAAKSGAAPVQVEVPDIPQAFSTGQVEAMMTSPSTGVGSKAWDFVEFYSPVNAWIPKNVVVINKDAFDALDEETRQAVLMAAEAAEKRGWEMSQQEDEAMTKELANNGMTVVEPSEDLVAGLRAIGEEMKKDWEATANQAAKDVVAKLK